MAKGKSKKETGVEVVKQGKIKYNKNLTKVQQKALDILSKKINLNGFRWEIVNGLFEEANIRVLLEATAELNINHLGLSNNKYPNIIKDICVFPSFYKLQTLIMPQNLIESLESLRNLNAPLLWRIDVRNNLIHSLRTFSKMFWPKLSMLVIGQNRVTQIPHIWEIQAPILGWIDLESNPTLSYARPILKCQSNTINHLYMHECGFVKEKEMAKPFKKKCEKKIHYTIFKSYGQPQDNNSNDDQRDQEG